MTKILTADFRATPETLADIRRVVDQWCARVGASPEDRHAVVLAVDEACTNVVEHGYAGGDSGAIHLRCQLRSDEVRVTVRDTGRSFHPDDAPPPDLESGWEERRIGGLGWHLIRGMVDEVRYRADPAGNELTLVKRLTREPTTGAT